MRTGYIVVFLIFPIFLDGCCVGNHSKKKTGTQQNIIHQHYRAVDGEQFMMPCFKCEDQSEVMVWSKTEDDREGNERFAFSCESVFPAEAKHSGWYTSLSWSLLSSGSSFSLLLQVVKSSLQPEETRKVLVIAEGGKVPCPGFNSSTDTNVIWYKGNRTVSAQNRQSCVMNGWLHLCKVHELDGGIYFCERQMIDEGVIWTVRRAIHVKAVPYNTPPTDGPRITYPKANMTEEVELGQSHTLVCEVFFPFEIEFSPVVLWYVHHGDNMENMTELPMERQEQETSTHHESKVTQRAIIKKETVQHVDNRYTCVAINTVNSSQVTINLKEKIKAKWPSLVGYPIASLLLVSGLGIILNLKWLELKLIYRSRLQYGKHSGDEKEFDVLLSYVWSPLSAEAEGVSTLSTRSGSETSEEACLPSMDLLNSEEGNATQTPLEVLLPQVLEDQWGYRLCLLDRDLMPGGAFTNDVVHAIQSSRMLICLLSADYLSNSNAVFVLETGVQALLQNSTLKLLLIWTGSTAGSPIQPDPQLPILVQRALKVLPCLRWTSGKPGRATSSFLRSLRRAMPCQGGILHSCKTNS